MPNARMKLLVYQLAAQDDLCRDNYCQLQDGNHLSGV